MAEQSAVRFSGQGSSEQAGRSEPAGQPGAAATEATGAVAQVSAQETTTQANPTGLSEETRALIAAEVKRQTQSQTAKLENRVKSMVEQQLATLKAAGVNLAPEQVRAVENTVRQQVAADESPAEPAQPEAQPVREGKADSPSPVDMKADAIMDTLGVEIETSDPEAKLLDHSSEQAFLKSLVTAIQVKQQRLTTSSAARVPAGGGQPSNLPAHAGLSGIETLEAYFHKRFNR